MEPNKKEVALVGSFVRTVKTLMQGTQIDNCPIQTFSATKNFSMPTLIEEMKPVVLVKYEFQYREKLKI